MWHKSQLGEGTTRPQTITSKSTKYLLQWKRLAHSGADMMVNIKMPYDALCPVLKDT
jgi:hypothetical protein